MGAAGSKRPCDKLVDACTSLDVAHDVAEVVSLFRAAVQGEPRDDGAAPPLLPVTAREAAHAVANEEGVIPDAAALSAAFSLPGDIGARLFDIAAALVVTEDDPDGAEGGVTLAQLVTLQATLRGGSLDALMAMCAALLADDIDGEKKAFGARALASLAALATGGVGRVDDADTVVSACAMAATSAASSSSALARLPAVAAAVRALLQPSLRSSLAPKLVGRRDQGTPPGAEDDTCQPGDIRDDTGSGHPSSTSIGGSGSGDDPSRRARPLLTPTGAWLLAEGMPWDWRRRWRMLYASDLHGLSFQTFLGRVAAEGPVLVVARAKTGAVFGGFASAPLAPRAEFYGDARSFVFSLEPMAAVYRATGHNTHFVWCAAGFTSERFPNGVGFGGQVGHFAVFLNGDFEGGHARDKAATYGAPSLAGQAGDFELESVEAWGVGPTPEEELGTRRGRRGTGGGVLHPKFDEVRRLMEAGRTDAGRPQREER